MTTNPENRLGRVMLVDDESFDRLMYKRILARTELADDILSFTYADEALEYLKVQENPKVDLILLDINMPRMSGFEFLEAAEASLGENFDAAVVIMLTTSLSPDDQKKASGFSAVKGYFNKPLAQNDLRYAAEIVSNHRNADTTPRLS